MSNLPNTGSACALTALIQYIKHCRLVGLNARHVAQKKSHLKKFIADTQSPIEEWRSDDLLESMRSLIVSGLSPRTANFRRQLVRAFTAWCTRETILTIDPFAHTPAIDERGERRYRRRALTEHETSLLMDAAYRAGVDRVAWYATALYAGLRRSELMRLRWRDVDLELCVLTVRGGKSGHIDRVPICDQLADRLEMLDRKAPETAVFKVVSHAERRADFDRAGVARVDRYGCVADLHSLRRTLHMRLVRSGVTPQVAQKVMRHSNYKTTLRFYTDDLERDGRKALNAAFSNNTGARICAGANTQPTPEAWTHNGNTITYLGSSSLG